MKLTIKEVLIVLLLATAFFIAGQFSYSWFIDHVIPKVEGAYFNVTSFESAFIISLKYSLIWAAVPVLSFLTWKLIPGLSTSKKIACVILILAGVISAVAIKYYFLSRELKQQVVNINKAPASTNFYKTLSEVNYEYWMTIGLLTGTILCFILFRKKKKKKWTK